MSIIAELTVEDVLRDADVQPDTLSKSEREAFDRDGFCIMPNVLESAWLDALRESFDTLIKKEGASAGLEVHQEKGTRRLADLVNKGAIYDGIWMHPRILAATHYVLKRDFKLLSLNARDAMPGEGAQGLHSDWSEPRVVGAPFHLVNALVCVDDFTADNGATRIVPGSHNLPGHLRDHVSDPSVPHPQEKLVICPAGSIAIINGQLWHGGTLNRSGQRRRVLHCAYVGREHPQFQMSQREYVRKSTWDRITPAARHVLDVL